MANWQGYFIAYTDGSGTDKARSFPLKYTDEKSWSSNPKFREEIKAYRDENTRNLHRVTASGKKSSFSFDIREGLHLADIEIIKNYFYNHESNHAERKIHLKYWDDENLTYDTGYFYRPNMEFKIKRVTDDDIIYDKLTLEFVEY